jgi:hypothetical protein
MRDSTGNPFPKNGHPADDYPSDASPPFPYSLEEQNQILRAMEREDRRGQKITEGTESPIEGVSEPILLSSAPFCPLLSPSVPITEEEFFVQVAEIVRASPLPQAAGRFYLPALKTLVAICAAAQSMTGELPFLLTCRRAAALLGIGHNRAWQLLMVLVRAGVLEIAKRGDSKHANRYRYLAD